MSVSLVSLGQSKTKDFLKTAHYPALYQNKILVNFKDPQIMAVDYFGQKTIFSPDKIYFTDDGKNYELCTGYCKEKNIQIKDLFKNAMSITFMADGDKVVPVLSSILVTHYSKK